MSPHELISHFINLKTYKHTDKRAPHKPLMLLLALGRLQQGYPRLVKFADIEEELVKLMTDFGPPRRPRPEYPFWHLRSSALWDIPKQETIPTQSGSASRKYLREQNIEGGFSKEAFTLLQANPHLVNKASHILLEDNFPPTYYDDLLADVYL